MKFLKRGSRGIAVRGFFLCFLGGHVRKVGKSDIVIRRVRLARMLPRTERLVSIGGIFRQI